MRACTLTRKIFKKWLKKSCKVGEKLFYSEKWYSTSVLKKKNGVYIII